MLWRARTSVVRAAPLALAVLSRSWWAGHSSADCAPKKRPKTGPPKPAAKKAGPALTAIEQALQPEKTYNVNRSPRGPAVPGAHGAPVPCMVNRHPLQGLSASSRLLAVP